MTSEPATVASATRWGGAAVMVALVAVVAAAPLVADALLPDTVVAAGALGRIGVYERVTFTEAGPSGDVVAGVIAPEGWRWVESRASGSFLSADGGSAITVGLRTGVADSAGLRRVLASAEVIG